jgi:hypothetical protein
MGLFNFDFAAKRVGIYDQGNQRIIMTTTDSIADSVVGIMNNPEATKNKLIRIHDFLIDNLEVVKNVEELTGVKYETYSVSTEEQTALAKSMPPSDTAAGIAVLALFWGKARAAEWDLPDDSELVGLKKKDLKEETVKALRTVKAIV